MINDIFNILLPQICLIIFIFMEIIISMFAKNLTHNFARIISLIGISLSIILLSTVQVEPQYYALKNSLISDNYTLLFHFMILLSGFFVVLLTKNISDSIKKDSYSFQALILTAILGAINIISSNDFLTLFVSIELLSFPLYILIATNNNYYSKEASFKYLITTAISTGVFLFGVSYLYGITSSLNLTEIYEIILEKETTLIYTFSVIKS